MPGAPGSRPGPLTPPLLRGQRVLGRLGLCQEKASRSSRGVCPHGLPGDTTLPEPGATLWRCCHTAGSGSPPGQLPRPPCPVLCLGPIRGPDGRQTPPAGTSPRVVGCSTQGLEKAPRQHVSGSAGGVLLIPLPWRQPHGEPRVGAHRQAGSPSDPTGLSLLTWTLPRPSPDGLPPLLPLSFLGVKVWSVGVVGRLRPEGAYQSIWPRL